MKKFQGESGTNAMLGLVLRLNVIEDYPLAQPHRTWGSPGAHDAGFSPGRQRLQVVLEPTSLDRSPL